MTVTVKPAAVVRGGGRGLDGRASAASTMRRTDADAAIAELRQRFAALQAELQRLRGTVAERDARIRELEQELKRRGKDRTKRNGRPQKP